MILKLDLVYNKFCFERDESKYKNVILINGCKNS